MSKITFLERPIIAHFLIWDTSRQNENDNVDLTGFMYLKRSREVIFDLDPYPTEM